MPGVMKEYSVTVQHLRLKIHYRVKRHVVDQLSAAGGISVTDIMLVCKVLSVEQKYKGIRLLPM